MPNSLKVTSSRAAKILTILWLLFIVSFTLLIYFLAKSDILANKFINPLKKQISDIKSSLEVRPTPTISRNKIIIITPSPTQVSKPKAKVTAKPQPKVVTNCLQKNIREGEFASNKCYSVKDFEDLNYYLQRFNSAVFNLDAAQSSMAITCSCRNAQSCEFFKDSCAKDQQQKSQAEADINKYRSTIQSIITKGR